MIRLSTALFFLLTLLGFTAVARAADLVLLPTDRLLILAPHPDDEVLCCGGMIEQAVQQGVPIKIVFLTYGDNNAWAFTMYHHFPVFRPKKMREMGELRRTETIAADDVLGVSPAALVFLGYPDYGTLSIWNNHWGSAPAYQSRMTVVRAVPYSTAYRPGAVYKGEEILRDLEAIIQDFRPTKIFVPHSADIQSDHRALHLFAKAALKTRDKDMTPAIYAYLIHFPAWPTHRGLHKDLALEPPATLKDSLHWLTVSLQPSQVDKKYEALKKHRTQWAYSSRFMSSFVRRNELFLDITNEETSNTDSPSAK